MKCKRMSKIDWPNWVLSLRAVSVDLEKHHMQFLGLKNDTKKVIVGSELDHRLLVLVVGSPCPPDFVIWSYTHRGASKFSSAS